MRPTASQIAKGRTTTKGKGTKRKKIECDCCGSWSHEKMDCPFAFCQGIGGGKGNLSGLLLGGPKVVGASLFIVLWVGLCHGVSVQTCANHMLFTVIKDL